MKEFHVINRLFIPVVFLIFIHLACGSSSSKPAVAERSDISARQLIGSIENYIVYYGLGRADDLAGYDLAIVQPETLNSAELAMLNNKGVLVAAYLSLGEVDPSRPWYTDGRVESSWLLGKNDNWGSFYVDARQPGWYQLVIGLAGEYAQKGFTGLFLDTVDTTELFPETRNSMIALIRALRAAYPQLLLIQNRGFKVALEVSMEIDALMFEGLSTGYDFDARRYTVGGDEAAAREIAKLHKDTALPILALDYVPLDNPGLAYMVAQVARDYGFIPAVSVIDLGIIPDYGLDKGAPTDLHGTSLDMADDIQGAIAVTAEIIDEFQ